MKILVPFDGSSYSTNSLEFVASRATLLGNEPEIRLLVVLEKLPSRAAALLAPDGVKAYFDDAAEKILKPARKLLKKHHVTVEERVVQGEPDEVIAQEADDFDADLIIMGSRGRTAFEGLFMGSVTTGVLARTKHPVLMLRGREAPEGDALKVGICVDGSDFGKAAVKFVTKHKALFGRAAKYSLLSVTEDYSTVAMPSLGFGLPKLTPDDMKKMQQAKFDQAIEDVKPMLDKAKIEAKEVPLVGNPGDEIAAYAKKKLDLLVLGSHGYGRFKSAIMGSTAMRIASQGDVPILLIRQ